MRHGWRAPAVWCAGGSHALLEDPTQCLTSSADGGRRSLAPTSARRADGVPARRHSLLSMDGRGWRRTRQEFDTAYERRGLGRPLPNCHDRLLGQPRRAAYCGVAPPRSPHAVLEGASPLAPPHAPSGDRRRLVGCSRGSAHGTKPGRGPPRTHGLEPEPGGPLHTHRPGPGHRQAGCGLAGRPRAASACGTAACCATHARFRSSGTRRALSAFFMTRHAVRPLFRQPQQGVQSWAAVGTQCHACAVPASVVAFGFTSCADNCVELAFARHPGLWRPRRAWSKLQQCLIL